MKNFEIKKINKEKFPIQVKSITVQDKRTTDGRVENPKDVAAE